MLDVTLDGMLDVAIDAAARGATALDAAAMAGIDSRPLPPAAAQRSGRRLAPPLHASRRHRLDFFLRFCMHLTDATLTHAGAWLLAQVAQTARVASFPDTIITKAVAPEAGWFETLSTWLRAAMTLAILVLTVAVVPAAWNFRKSYQKVSDLLDRIYADINPIAHHASRIAENVDYVSTAVRADVQRASATLTDANNRLQEAIVRAESRARDLDALIAVMQDEAEGAFVSTASTVRGVRTGMETLRDALRVTLRDVRDAALDPTPVGTSVSLPNASAVAVNDALYHDALAAAPGPGARIDEDETHGTWGDEQQRARARGPRVRPRYDYESDS